MQTCPIKNLFNPICSKLNEAKQSIKTPACVRSIFEKNGQCLSKIKHGVIEFVSISLNSLKKGESPVVKKVHQFALAFFSKIASCVRSSANQVKTFFSDIRDFVDNVKSNSVPKKFFTSSGSA